MLPPFVIEAGRDVSLMNSALLDDLKAESDADLIAAVALQSYDRESAISALEELHRRYSEFCMNLATGHQGLGIDPEFAVTETFFKLWQRADTFSVEKRRKGVSKENAVKSWIAAILDNQITDQVRKQVRRAEKPLLDGFESTDRDTQADAEHARPKAAGNDPFAIDDDLGEVDEEDETLRPTSIQREMLEKLMSQLTQKEQQILELSARYIEPFPPFRCSIPKDQLECLAARIGVAPSSVKVMRQRAYTKLRDLAATFSSQPSQS